MLGTGVTVVYSRATWSPGFFFAFGHGSGDGGRDMPVFLQGITASIWGTMQCGL